MNPIFALKCTYSVGQTFLFLKRCSIACLQNWSKNQIDYKYVTSFVSVPLNPACQVINLSIKPWYSKHTYFWISSVCTSCYVYVLTDSTSNNNDFGSGCLYVQMDCHLPSMQEGNCSIHDQQDGYCKSWTIQMQHYYLPNKHPVKAGASDHQWCKKNNHVILHQQDVSMLDEQNKLRTNKLKLIRNK